jgi:hypothetical protein
MTVIRKLSGNWVKRRIESEDRGTCRLPRIGVEAGSLLKK